MKIYRPFVLVGGYDGECCLKYGSYYLNEVKALMALHDLKIRLRDDVGFAVFNKRSGIEILEVIE